MNSGDSREPSNWQGFVYISDVVDDRSSQAALPLDVPENPLNARVVLLFMTQVGDRVRIVSFNCGKANNRLMEIGLMPNVELEVD